MLDTDPYAVPAQDGILWMVNALTTSDAYPYSALALLGSNADLRTEMRPLELINYAADSVKATIDATTGQVTLYQFSDEPVIATWARVYPELFQKRSAMPEDVRAHVQYPLALMSIQFNKIYPFYHQRDALTFYSGEDLLDDADEVVGPIRGQSGAITFSQGLYTPGWPKRRVCFRRRMRRYSSRCRRPTRRRTPSIFAPSSMSIRPARITVACRF